MEFVGWQKKSKKVSQTRNNICFRFEDCRESFWNLKYRVYSINNILVYKYKKVCFSAKKLPKLHLMWDKRNRTNEYKNETFDEKRRFLEGISLKTSLISSCLTSLTVNKKSSKPRKQAKIHDLTFCSDVPQLCLTLFFLICFEHFNCYFTFSSFLHFFPSRRVFIVFVHFLDSLYFVPSRFFAQNVSSLNRLTMFIARISFSTAGHKVNGAKMYGWKKCIIPTALKQCA